MKNFIVSLFRLFLPCVFDAANMNLGHFGTQRMWLYRSSDAIATVIGANYFDAHAELMRNGDVIIAVDVNLNTVDLLMVSSADGASTITVANGT